MPIPSVLAPLFWDVDPASLDLDLHRDYVLERVMVRGDLDAMRWLITAYDDATRADFLRRRGHRLPPRERAFWALVSGTTADSATGGGRPPWAG